LGDFLLQAVFYAQMGSEQGLFGMEDALDAINEKLVRRHPHVFGEESAESASDVKRIWGEVKAAEKKDQGREESGLLGSVPRALPALVEAQQIASRAAGVGFDWENPEQVLDKLQEELAEFDEARRNHSPVQLEDELGDLLFVLVNLARFVKVDPEQALRKTNVKFRERFGYIERKLAERGRKPQDSNIEEMEALWQEAKR
jgi:MazG family protein